MTKEKLTSAPSVQKQMDTYLKCVITGQDLTKGDRIVRLFTDKAGVLDVSLTSKKHKDAVYFHLTYDNVMKIKIHHKDFLSELFEQIPQTEFDDIPNKIKDILKNKLLASMGFALKTKKAVIGKRAIERQINLFPEMISDIFIAEDASSEITRKFQQKASGTRFTMGFPVKWIQKISARDKASYFLLKKNYANHHIYDDYKCYQALSKI